MKINLKITRVILKILMMIIMTMMMIMIKMSRVISQTTKMSKVIMCVSTLRLIEMKINVLFSLLSVICTETVV